MLDSLIAKHKLLILDGALATELERQGCDLRDDLWSAKILLEDPARIVAVHRSYFEAGADISITATYQASLDGLRKYGLDEEAAMALMTKSVDLARQAQSPQQRPTLIAGSVGSYGAYLTDGSEYYGHFGVDEQTLIDFHRPRMASLSGHADLYAMETIPCLSEARALIQLLQEFPHMTGWLAFSARDDKHLCEGDPVEEAAALAEAAPQITAVGINCSKPEYITSLARRMSSVTRKPIVAYPNSGEIYRAETGQWQSDPQNLDSHSLLDDWYEAGVRLLGGCCRTTPEFIRSIVDWRVSRFTS